MEAYCLMVIVPLNVSDCQISLINTNIVIACVRSNKLSHNDDIKLPDSED